MIMHTTALECNIIKPTWSYCSVFFNHSSVPLTSSDCIYKWPLRKTSSLRNVKLVSGKRFKTSPLTSSRQIRSVTCPHLLPAPFLFMFPRPHPFQLSYPLTQPWKIQYYKVSIMEQILSSNTLSIAKVLKGNLYGGPLQLRRFVLHVIERVRTSQPLYGSLPCMAFVLQYRPLCSTKNSRSGTSKCSLLLALFSWRRSIRMRLSVTAKGRTCWGRSANERRNYNPNVPRKSMGKRKKLEARGSLSWNTGCCSRKTPVWIFRESC